MAAIFSLWIGKETELILYFVCYVNLRYMFPKTFHHNNYYHCIFWSIVMMWSAAYTVMKFNTSILSTVLFAYLVGYVLYRIQDYIDMSKLINDEVLFRKRCKDLGMSNEYIEFAVNWKVKGIKNDYQLLELHKAEISSINSVKTRKQRINKLLNSVNTN